MECIHINIIAHKNKNILQGDAAVAIQAHNLKVVGSNPIPAPKGNPHLD